MNFFLDAQLYFRCYINWLIFIVFQSSIKLWHFLLLLNVASSFSFLSISCRSLSWCFMRTLHTESCGYMRRYMYIYINRYACSNTEIVRNNKIIIKICKKKPITLPVIVYGCTCWKASFILFYRTFFIFRIIYVFIVYNNAFYYDNFDRLNR